MKRRGYADTLRCSFCGKSQREVEKLIAGPTVYICNECIDICNEIIADDMRQLAEQHREGGTQEPNEESAPVGAMLVPPPPPAAKPWIVPLLRTWPAAALTLRMMHRRFGSVDAELESQIWQLSFAQLEQLTEALSGFSTVADLAAWMNNLK